MWPRVVMSLWVVVVVVMVTVPDVNAEAKIWYPAKISTSKLSPAKSFTTTNFHSQTICAIKATQTEWSYMFTYEDDTCSLYDAKIGGYDDESNLGDTTTCKTRLLYECVVNDIVYDHGSSNLDDCTLMVCWNKVFGPITSDMRVCADPFLEVPGLGCIYLNIVEKTWDDARDCCITMGADLFVATGNFKTLQNYLQDFLSDQVWVGVRDQKWVDDRAVTVSEWGPNDPDGSPTDCARMLVQGDFHFVGDRQCDVNFKSLCQRTFY
ncbi:uncharacterized protein LOC121859070 [Homarus americanus]|uniref:uncharacterized protein LOC121859070 n=1 Tax=Homarus americanus TaxID=6706 RepID=UPI001C44221A|nr:uncharacterized protein LOC121859070 [Homarus americanus]